MQVLLESCEKLVLPRKTFLHLINVKNRNGYVDMILYGMQFDFFEVAVDPDI